MRNNKVKSERGIIQKEIFLHTNKFQQWFSVLSTPKEFVKGGKRKNFLYVIQNYPYDNFKGVCTCLVEFEKCSACKGEKMLKICRIQNERLHEVTA